MRHKWTPLFLEARRREATVGLAAELAGVNRSTPYRRRDSDPAFAAAWERVEAELQGEGRGQGRGDSAAP